MKISPQSQKIVNQVIETLEQGNAAWQKPWKAQKRLTNINYITGHEYSGINRLMTFMLRDIAGYSDNRWITFKQAAEKGLKVKKGEKALPITHFSVREIEDESRRDEAGNPEKRMIPYQKFYYIFNMDQIEGEIKPDDRLKDLRIIPTWEQEAAAEAVLKNSQANIKHHNGSAYYRPLYDDVFLPFKGMFDNAAGYYSTALHELAHWTGHKDRLGRTMATAQGNITEYAREELRAELANWMLAEALEIDFEPQNSSAYVADWIQIFKDRPQELFRAAADAERIKNYLSQYQAKQ